MHHLNPASPARATSPSSKITAQSNPPTPTSEDHERSNRTISQSDCPPVLTAKAIHESPLLQ
ncbi:hypothetical protein V6Z98_007907 [Aspergillus fumigatus]